MKNKIQKIMELMRDLYSFDEEGIQNYMKKIPYMKEEGLNQLIKTLKTGKEEEENIIKKWIEKNPNKTREFLDFINKSSKKLETEYRKSETNMAESILENI